jgi:hypothetical protein
MKVWFWNFISIASFVFQDLRELFTHCGEVKYAEMKERGTGLVRFNSERDAERAVCKFF